MWSSNCTVIARQFMIAPAKVKKMRLTEYIQKGKHLVTAMRRQYARWWCNIKWCKSLVNLQTSLSTIHCIAENFHWTNCPAQLPLHCKIVGNKILPVMYSRCWQAPQNQHGTQHPRDKNIAHEIRDKKRQKILSRWNFQLYGIYYVFT